MNINFAALLLKMPNLLRKGGLFLAYAARKRSRSFLNAAVTESFYLAMYATFVAFLLGLSVSLQWRYKDKFLSGFVKISLPALGKPSQELAWETFQHLISKEAALTNQDSIAARRVTAKAPSPSSALSLLVDNPIVKRIDVYNDSLFIEFKTPWDKLKTQKYIGLYPEKVANKQLEKTVPPAVSHSLGNENENLLENLEGKGQASGKANSLVHQIGANSQNRVGGDNRVVPTNKAEVESRRKETATLEQDAKINNWQKSLEFHGNAGDSMILSRRTNTERMCMATELLSLRWLKIPARDLVSLQNGSFFLSLNTNKGKSFGAATHEKLSLTPFSKGLRDESPLFHINPLALQKPNSPGLPESFELFQLISHPLSSKAAGINNNRYKTKTIKSTQKWSLLPQHIAPNWKYQLANHLDELPYKLSNNQMSTPVLSAIEQGQWFTRLQAKGFGSKPVKGGVANLGKEEISQDQTASSLPSRGSVNCNVGLQQTILVKDAVSQQTEPNQTEQMGLAPQHTAAQANLLTSDLVWTRDEQLSVSLGISKTPENLGQKALAGHGVGRLFSSKPKFKIFPTRQASLKINHEGFLLRGAAIGSCNGTKNSRLRNTATAPSSAFFEKGHNFKESKPYSMEEKQSIAISLERGLGYKTIAGAEGLLEKEVISVIPTDSIHQGSRWGWRSIHELLEEADNAEIASLFISGTIQSNAELPLKQTVEGKVALAESSTTMLDSRRDKEEGWEDVFNLLNSSRLNLLQSVKRVSPRLASGYHFPDLPTKQMNRMLFRLLARKKFQVRQIAAEALLAEIEVRLLNSPSDKIIAGLAQIVHKKEASITTSWAPGKQASPELVSSMPIAELVYQHTSFNELQPLRSTLSALRAEIGDEESENLGILRPMYQGPAVAKDMATNDIAVKNKEDIAEWIAKRIQGSGSIFAGPQALDGGSITPDRQSNFLGKKENLRGEALMQQELFAALRSRPATSVSDTAAASTGQAKRKQPIKNGEITLDGLLTGSYSRVSPYRLKDASQIVWSDKSDETPIYPLEIVLAKSLPIFEEEHEILALNPKEWDNLFEAVVAQAIETKSALDKVELLIPSIAVAAQKGGTSSLCGLVRASSGIAAEHPASLEAVSEPLANGGDLHSVPSPLMLQELEVEGVKLRARKAPSTDLALSNSNLGLRTSGYMGASRVSSLRKPLTFQDYRSLTGLVVQSREYIGERNYYAAVDSAKQPKDDKPPILLCHYLPLTESTVIESSPKRTIAAGTYQKRLTSFVSRHQRKRAFSTDRSDGNSLTNSGLGNAERQLFNRPQSSETRHGSAAIFEHKRQASYPLLLEGPSKIKPFQQTWEPITSNSWMMVYKLCFAIWVKEMGRDFYQRYGKEIILYALNLLVALGFNAQGIIEDLGLEDSPMRVITNGQTRFSDIAGIDSVLPELGEIVWFLRSSGRGGQVPKGILLVGPPGTGKTLVVQAIGGESKVPVIVQSASALTDSSQKQSGSQKLRNLFDKARELAPCVLFMDEIDTLGASRPDVIGNTMGAEELVESIETSNQPEKITGSAKRQLKDVPPSLLPHLHFLPAPRSSRESMLGGGNDDRSADEQPLSNEGKRNAIESSALDPSVVEVMESQNEERRSKQERLALLMQFLMEMDGLRSLHGVVVIGATNRPGVLDPAFTRPGRFERVLCLQLPGKQKRIEILKLYSKNLGIEGWISWDYLANRTTGLSAAHLAATMNQSAIRAIIEDTTHTIETVEHGISVIARHFFQASSTVVSDALAQDLPASPAEAIKALLATDCQWLSSETWGQTVTTNTHVETRANSLRQNSEINLGLAKPRQVINPQREEGAPKGRDGSLTEEIGLHQSGSDNAIMIARLGYFQAGKAVLQTLLPLHPPVSFLPLHPQRFNRAASNLRKIVALDFQQNLLEPHRRNVLETHLLGFYAGKAGELLALSSFSADHCGARANWSFHDKVGSSATTSKTSGFRASGDNQALVKQMFKSSGLTGQSKHGGTLRAENGERITDIYSSLNIGDRLERGAFLCQSDLGVEELTFASAVANRMVDSWYFYAKKVALQKSTLVDISQNLNEIEDPVLLELFKHIAEEREYEVKRRTLSSQRFQQWSPPTWWQTQALVETSLVEPGYSEWYRLYIPDPEETERNIDWIPPEDHYHSDASSRLKSLSHKSISGVQSRDGSRKTGSDSKQSFLRKKGAGACHTSLTWNDLYLVNRDYIYHGLVNACFHKAFSLIESKRELLDCFVDSLLRYGSLRQSEIQQIAQNFDISWKSSIESSNNRSYQTKFDSIKSRQTETNEPIAEQERQRAETCSSDCFFFGSVDTRPFKAQADEVTATCSKDPMFPQKVSTSTPSVDPDWTIPPSKTEKSIKESSKKAPQICGELEASNQLSELGADKLDLLPPAWASIHVAEAEWGSSSRRRAARFIGFDFVKPCFLKSAQIS